MRLRAKQSVFVRNIAELIHWAYEEGYELTFAEAYRPQDVAEMYARDGRGIKTSLHCSRLAIDLNLFRGGEYLTRTEDYAPLGAFWKSLHALNRWGGDFRMRDAVHFSMAHGGRM